MRLKKILLAMLAVVTLLSMAACEKVDGNLYEVYFDYDLDAIVELGQYKNVVVETRDPVPTEEEIQESIHLLLDEHSKLQGTDRTIVEEGDVIYLAYTGYINGEFQQDMVGSMEFELGRGVLIPDFERQLIGLEKDKDHMITVVFPEDYFEPSLQSAKVNFSVKISSIKDKIYPEYNDAFVAEKTDYNTTEEYYEHVKKTLTEQNKQAISKNLWNLVWEKVQNDSNVTEYPKATLDEYRANSLEYITNIAINTYKMETLLEYVSTILQMDYNAFSKQIEENCKSMLKEELVTLAIIKAEGLSLDWDTYKEKGKQIAKDYGYTTLGSMEKDYDRKDIVMSIAYKEIIGIVLPSASTTIKK